MGGLGEGTVRLGEDLIILHATSIAWLSVLFITRYCVREDTWQSFMASSYRHW